jgi:hypothetical protein
MHLYLATKLRPGRTSWDASEEIQVLEASPAQCLRWVRSGKIKDQASALGILLYLSSLKRRK